MPEGLDVEPGDIEEPEQLLASREVVKDGQHIKQWLVKWKGGSEEDTTWENETLLQSQFPNLSLEEKAACDGGSIDRTHGPDPDFHVDTGVDPHRPAVWKVYVRKRKGGIGKN